MENKYKFNRIFVIVADSLGIGEEPDAAKFDDCGSNTFAHAAETVDGIKCKNMEAMGLGELDDIKGVGLINTHPNCYDARLREASNGKDTMTGHWEMMGILTLKPFKTFTDTGFPKELIDELERQTGHKVIGNYSSSGTEILKVLGEEQTRDASLIVYTSADSVLQIAANESCVSVEELYRCCEIARKICMKSEYLVGRVIARPFVGTNKDNFKRDGANRHDYTVSPTGTSVMDILKENGFTVSAIGKINDIFNGVGITRTIHTATNEEGMDEAIRQLRKDNYQGLCFVNLVEFDSEYGHRRNPVGYARCIEAFDKRIGEFISYMKDGDLLIVTADHGNDPTFKGTDHTREKVPFLAYSPCYKKGRFLGEYPSFATIGASILRNFNLSKKGNMIGEEIKELFED